MTTAFTPQSRHLHQRLGPLASRIVRPEAMEWEPIRYPGCAVKTLLVDPASGLLTVLLKMEPGASLPDHEHARIEQTYMLQGTLVDLDGPEKGLEVGAGEFVYRPAGSRHAAGSPDGALMLAIFQVPNRFFEPGGGVVDMLGRAWQAQWGHVVG